MVDRRQKRKQLWKIYLYLPNNFNDNRLISGFLYPQHFTYLIEIKSISLLFYGITETYNIQIYHPVLHKTLKINISG